MNEPLHEEPWERRLRDGLGDPPRPDFDAWRAAHPEAAAALADQRPAGMLRLRPRLAPRLKWLAASVAAAAVGLLLVRPPAGLEKQAFASIAGVDDQKALTWSTTFYHRTTSADGKRTWIGTERRLHAFRYPGQYRETFLDPEGKPYAVEVTDARAGRTLALDLKNKKARLKAATRHYDPRGPFAWVGDAVRDRAVAKTLPVKSVSLQGQKEVDRVTANVVRVLIDEGSAGGDLRRDFLFDPATKKLVAVWLPNDRDFDPESAADRNNPAEKDWSTQTALGYREHEIVLDPKLDPGDFSLDAPAGYAVEKVVPPTVTEDEMAAYLGAAARFNGDAFPDSPFAAFDTSKFNAAGRKPAADRTPAESEMIAQDDRFKGREIYVPPVRQFLDDHAAPGTFHYVGAAAKLGDAKRIVAWYTPRQASKPRALFADLSVRDVEPAELPFDLTR